MDFADIYRPPRAGRYANPLNSNDVLPLVYGDLTDGLSGNWQIPCINVNSFVYAYAGFTVISSADGNTINIYADDVLVNADSYSFVNSTDYESQGGIATITFFGDQGNTVISARGQGRDDGASSLYENVIDQINDFLVVQSDASSADFDVTAKAEAKAIFTTLAYTSAGIINEDESHWGILQRMMASFLGSAYLSTEKKLILDIDDGTLPVIPAAIIPKGQVELITAVQRDLSLVNQCPAAYAYDYVKREFRSVNDGSGTKDAASQNIYGERLPEKDYEFFWCRDATAVQSMQALVVDKYSEPVWEIEFNDKSLRGAHVDLTDVIAASFDDLYDDEQNPLINQLMQVIAVKPNLEQYKIGFRAIDTGAFLTIAYLADGSYEAGGSVRAGGERDQTHY